MNRENFISMVAVTVNGVRYLTKVPGYDYLEAQYLVSGWGYRGLHDRTVRDCLGFDRKYMKSDEFVDEAFNSTLIELEDLHALIEERNKELREQDELEEAQIKAEDLRKQIAELQEQLDETEKVLARVKRTV